MGDDRLYLTVDELFRAYDRARVLERVLDVDPADLEAMRAYADLVRDGFDVAEPELLHGFTPEEARGLDAEPASVPHRAIEDEWVAKLLDEALDRMRGGEREHAIELLDSLLHIAPEHDVARALLHELEAQRSTPPRTDADATVRLSALTADVTLRLRAVR